MSASAAFPGFSQEWKERGPTDDEVNRGTAWANNAERVMRGIREVAGADGFGKYRWEKRLTDILARLDAGTIPAGGASP